MRTTLWLLAACWLGGLVTVEADERLFVRQQQFRIPFELSKAESPDREAKEVQLWFRPEQGAWSLYTTVSPDRDHFVYQGEWQGEIWFVVRTITFGGERLPPDNSAKDTVPELKVVIDREPPQISLEAMRGEAGQLVISWDVFEDYPLGKRPLIQSRPADTDEPWQTVAVSGGWSGRTELPPQQDALEIRATAVDRAGNASAVIARFDPQRSERVRGQQAAADSQAIEEARKRATQSPAPQMADQRSVDRVAYEVSRPEAPRRGGEPGLTSAADLFPGREAPSTGGRMGLNERPEDLDRSPGMPPPTRGETPGRPAPQAPPRFEPPEGIKPYLVDYPRFELHYDTAKLAPEGAEQIEIWGTADGGQTWELFALDEDGRSPAQVEVPGDGVYGFRYVARGGRVPAGQRQPSAGDRPEIWIEVDASEPEVEILGITDTNTARRREIEIRWKADDHNLLDRPIAVYFSYAPNGPWNPLASELENTGRFVWPNSEFNHRVLYFRVEARDRNGYVGYAEASNQSAARKANSLEAASRLRGEE